MNLSLKSGHRNTSVSSTVIIQKDSASAPIVGKAYEYLLELRLEHGPLGEERAKKELLNWWAKNQS